MKIKKIEIENFRNFKDRSIIECSTDGKVTIIYGKNGDGKTTLHQFFQWMFYGAVHFNKTTTNRLYNLELEENADYNSKFTVYGNIEFEHNGHEYSLIRTCKYKKGLNTSTLENSDLVLSMRTDDFDWKSIDNPNETIEKLIPSGLAEYFFFDGESMIADLRTTGRASATKLKAALYSIFDLDTVEAAINHIGRTDLKTTVLGKLFVDPSTVYTDDAINKLRYELENAQEKRADIEGKIEENNKKVEELQELVNTISEQIGSTKSKEAYEKERAIQKKNQDIFLNNITNAQHDFGESVIDIYPKLLIAKAVEEAGSTIHMQVAKYKLPSGITKKLIEFLTDPETEECVCGNKLCAEERKHVKEFLNYMPPRSYASFYQEFKNTAKAWGKEYNPDILHNYIKSVIENMDASLECDAGIKRIDEEEKNSKDISDLVVDRANAEAKIMELTKENSDNSLLKKQYELLVKKKMTELEEKTKATENGKKQQQKIELMKRVLTYFEKELQNEADRYSKKLQTNIQLLVNRMLTSKRNVNVSKEFAVTITDSHQDESKSEGQFAVVSFAYIGGILKLLKETEKLSNKEYPLVLDGPFSKLDTDQRQNVAETIPQFAPQIILFSKDNLQDVFDKDKIGKVWTIQSNSEKNVASIKEGYLW